MLTKQEKERLTAAERSYWKDESMVKHCVSRALLLFDLRGKIFTSLQASPQEAGSLFKALRTEQGKIMDLLGRRIKKPLR